MSNILIEDRKKRRKIFNENYIKKMLDVVTEDGIYIGNDGTPGFREVVWHCMVLLRTGNSVRANTILKNLEIKKCHFLPMNFTQVLFKYGDLLDEEVKEKLEKYIKAHFIFIKSDRIHISMYNDNFANMAIYTCLIAGEMFNNQEMFNVGLNKLREVGDLFSRCGVLMEYGSPTYTPIDTLCFAEIANHVKNEQARQLALHCEKRMMVELATHYHPATSMMAGPYSRAYAIDMMGHPHLLSGLYWLLYGEQVFVNPINYLFTPLEKQMMHGGLEGLTLPNIAWVLDCDYHIDESLINIALHKEYPYHVTCMTECIPSNVHEDPTDANMHEYGGYRGVNTSYMTEEFSLGTAQSQFHGGALSESFYITYKNKENAQKLEDVGVIYSRYIFNDKLPEQLNHYELFGDVNASGYRDEGRKFTVQKDGEALVIYKPKQYERRNVTSAKLQIMIPCHFFSDFEIFVGNEKVIEFPYENKQMETVYISVNQSNFAFSPLSFTNYGINKSIEIKKANNHIIISFYNYEGNNRSFGIREMLLTSAGFLVVCKKKNEYTNFQEFTNYVNQGVIEDKIETQEGAASRIVRYRNKNIDLLFKYSPISEGIYVATVDKKPIGMAILEADGIKNSDIPFL